MKKKVLSLALALVMCLGLLSVTALAADGDFTIQNGELTKYNGPGGDVTIPNSVTSIADFAFQNCTALTSVTIPDSVTRIGMAAFYGCTGLTSVTIPNSLTDIRMGALIDTPWIRNQGEFAVVNGILLAYLGTGGNVTIPAGVTSIGEGAFMYCPGLTSVTIPNSVTSIGMAAFSGCARLPSVTIPSSVTSIGPDAFVGCRALTSVTLPSSVAEIGMDAFLNCTSLKDVYYGSNEAQWKAIKIDNFANGNQPLLNATIHYNGGTQPQQPSTPTQPTGTQAAPTNNPLSVDGTAASTAVYKIDGSNYFKLRDVAALLNGSAKQFDVGYDDAAKSAAITTGQGYTKLSTDLQPAPAGAQTATASNDSVIVNGKKVDLTVYKINGANYFKLRDLGKALDFYVGYDDATKSMSIDTSKPYSE